MWDVHKTFSFLPACVAVDVWHMQTCVSATLVMSALTFQELEVTVKTPLLLCSSFNPVNEKCAMKNVLMKNGVSSC